MKSQNGLWISLFSCVAFAAGCGGSGLSGKDGQLGTSQSPSRAARAVLSSPKGLFLAGTGSGGSQSLNQVGASGQVAPVEFLDSNEKPVEVSVTHLQPLDASYTALVLSYSDGTSKTGLLRVSDGAIIDISDFSADSAQIRGGYIYVLGKSDGTIYKIDLVSLSATPINNAAYDPADGPSWNNGFCATFVCYNSGEMNRYNSFLIGNGDDVVAHVSGGGYKIFFSDNTAPYFWNVADFQDVSGGTSGGIVYGEDGYVYQVKFDGTGTRIFKKTASHTGIAASAAYVDSAVAANTILATFNSYTLNDRSRYLLTTSGFYKMSAVPGGGIDLVFTALDLSSLPNGGASSSAHLSGDYAYWQSGNTIKRIHLASGASAQDVVTDSNLISFSVVGGNVLYTKYITGTHVGTYSVVPGGSPSLVSDSDVKVQQLVELQ